jgi:hypothetical protein
VDERQQTTVAFGPVGLGGFALLVLGVLLRRRLLALVGLAGVIADVTVPELGGFRAAADTLHADKPSASTE